MNERITEALLEQFQQELEYEEKAKLTIEKYMRDIRNFTVFFLKKRRLLRKACLHTKSI